MMYKKHMRAIFGVLLAGAVGIVGVVYAQRNDSAPEVTKPSVVVERVRGGAMVDEYSTSGVLKGTREVIVSAAQGGRLLARPAVFGERFAEGEVLAVQDAALAGAQASGLAAVVDMSLLAKDATNALYADKLAQVGGAQALASSTLTRNGSATAIVAALTAAQGAQDLLSIINLDSSYTSKFSVDLARHSTIPYRVASEAYFEQKKLHATFRALYDASIQGKTQIDPTVLAQGTRDAKKVLVAVERALSLAHNALDGASITSTESDVEMTAYRAKVVEVAATVQSALALLENTESSARTLALERDAALYGADASRAQAEVQRDVQSIIAEQLIVRAPFNGVVAEEIAEVGAMLAPGSPVVRLIDDTILEADVVVPENIARMFTKEMVVEISLTGERHEERHEARIVQIGAVADVATKSVVVRIAYINDDRILRAGSAVRVFFAQASAEEAETIFEKDDAPHAISRSALHARYGQTYVFIVEDNVIRKKLVTVQAEHEANVAVLGLARGEQVVMSGARNLRDGDVVFVRFDDAK